MEHETIAKCMAEEMLPQKGETSTAIKGEEHLIALVYDCRELPNLLQKKLEGKENTELNESELREKENIKTFALKVTL